MGSPTAAEYKVVLARLRDEHERGTEDEQLAERVGEWMRNLAEQTLEVLDEEALWTE